MEIRVLPQQALEIRPALLTAKTAEDRVAEKPAYVLEQMVNIGVIYKRLCASYLAILISSNIG